MNWISRKIAADLNVREAQVVSAIALLDEGATVPFIARYRKEATGGMSDQDLRALAEQLRYLRDLDERREVILKSIREQDKLSPELEARIMAVENKTQLEDLYLPYKPKRRTKAQIAREAGLAGLAELLWNDPTRQPQKEAESYLNADAGFNDVPSVLEGVKYILIEQFSESSVLVGHLREKLWKEAFIQSRVIQEKIHDGSKFSDYFDHREAIAHIAPHRALALLRGRNENVLVIGLAIEHHESFEKMMADHLNIQNLHRPADELLNQALHLAWRTKLWVSLELELLARMKERADEASISVFAANLRDLLLSAPAGAKVTMGLDPGIRTGVKVALVDQTGKLLDTSTVYPHEPRKDWQGALAELKRLVLQWNVELIAIGNGTASRETDQLVSDLLRALEPRHGIQKVMVSEAGASVYSASELASKEFPDLDVSLRGAVSIARRIQDPLAELVKIDPKSIGVGQYQHDVNPSSLMRSLDGVVEDCVNAVGVDVNTASVPLLARVSGLNSSTAQHIVHYRDQYGAFINRESLKKVPRLGPKTFEQAAGFLRIMKGDQPLDASAVHPEAYVIVEEISKSYARPIDSIIGDQNFLKNVKAHDFVRESFGLPTIQDILKELEKPGRDPRPDFITARFNDQIHDIKDLKAGMQLEGVVTNVTHFGAFVDIGVHHDGLVHISALAQRFVKDPREVVKAGQIVQVTVIDVDTQRQRINLSMLVPETPSAKPAEALEKNHARPSQNNGRPKGNVHKPSISSHARAPAAQKNNQPTSMALAFEKLKALKEHGTVD